MKQIFILGASSVYGVGAPQGWGDLVKQYAHTKAYEQGIGEEFEVFNFALSGATIEFVSSTLPWIMENYVRKNAEISLFVSVGGNDAKAQVTADNFVCTPEDFQVKVGDFLKLLQTYSSQIVFVSNSPVDESKVYPKKGHNNWPDAYFTNERRDLFNSIIKEECAANSTAFVSVEFPRDEWIKACMYEDGLHPNQLGYNKVFDVIKPELEKILA